MTHTESPAAALEVRLRAALRAAYALGITYWQQAKSDESDRADNTADAFECLLDESCRRLAEDATKAPSSAMADVSDSIKQLLKFYRVETLQDLAEAQYRHIERLQEKLRNNEPPAAAALREG